MSFYLYILIGGYNSWPSYTRTKMESFENCISALAAMKIDNASGGESENVVVAFCGGGDFSSTSVDRLDRWKK